MTDYRLSKNVLRFAEPRSRGGVSRRPGKVLARYGLTPEVKQAVLANDVSFSPGARTPTSCATFFFAAGMKDDEFIRRLRDG